jgi:hypothetical protein
MPWPDRSGIRLDLALRARPSRLDACHHDAARPRLYVIDDRVATSAGIASGIDLALHLIAIRNGPATTTTTSAD